MQTFSADDKNQAPNASKVSVLIGNAVSTRDEQPILDTTRKNTRAPESILVAHKFFHKNASHNAKKTLLEDAVHPMRPVVHAMHLHVYTHTYLRDLNARSMQKRQHARHCTKNKKKPDTCKAVYLPSAYTTLV